ncbi:MAG: adenylate/guanylate cyclase domain-containing protein [Nostoc sp.]|uniref:CHASE2 domain-containing protein n=1 Tax=Nostoc sp. TaxID=1180 RepID=UPI002FF7C64B
MWLKLKRLLWKGRSVWITTPSVAGLIVILRWAGLLQSWEWAAFDQYMRWRPQNAPDNRIVLVGINETDLHNLDESIISDAVLARLLKKLKAMQPRAIGLDIYRDLPVEPGHQELVRVFASTPNLIGIQKVVGDIGRETVAPSPVLKAKGQVGGNDLLIDGDNKVRRGFIYVADRDRANVFSFSFLLALHYLDAEGIAPKTIEGTKNWQLGKTVFAPFEANDGGYVRADARGYQLLIDYRGSSTYFETVSMTDILQNRVASNWGRDRIILIGMVGESFKDLYFTPYSSGLLTLSEPMAGLEIHANITSQIISAALKARPLFKSWSEPVEWLWIMFWSSIGATLSWKLRYTGGVEFLSFHKSASLFLAGGALLGSTYAAFLWGWWLPVVPPFLALGGSIAVITAYIARSAGSIRKTFGRYLTNEVVANLLESPEGLKMGGERRKITMLTSDLRGFTTTSEQLPAEEVVKILNFYLESVADAIAQYQGTIDEFMGDGILVLFGAPTAREDDAKRAVACAVAMQLVMAKVNERMKQWGLPPLEMGIGINTGEVVVGNIGSEKRTKYGVVGSQVNLTYRIESYTVGGQIFISESTLKEAGLSIVKINDQKSVLTKGVQQLITIYDVKGIGGEYNLFLPQEEEDVLLPLPEAMPIQYRILEGKHIVDTLFKGSLVKLSAKEAEIHADNVAEPCIPSPLGNIKLNLLIPSDRTEVSEDIYAKVLAKPAGDKSFFIHFTSKTLVVEAQLNYLYQSVAASNK